VEKKVACPSVRVAAALAPDIEVSKCFDPGLPARLLAEYGICRTIRFCSRGQIDDLLDVWSGRRSNFPLSPEGCPCGPGFKRLAPCWMGRCAAGPDRVVEEPNLTFSQEALFSSVVL